MAPKPDRGRPAVNRKWGNQVTVLAGDWLYMQSFAVALQQRNFQILDILIDLTQRMVEGELIQLTFNGNRRVSEADVLDIARRKTAYLFSGCARIGGVLGNASSEQQAALAQYGLSVGLAFQTVDDILDFSSNSKILGKPVVSDLKEGKVTLPIVYAMEQCTPAEARLIETVLRETGIQDSFSEGNPLSRGQVSNRGESPKSGSTICSRSPLRTAALSEVSLQRGPGSHSAVHSGSGKIGGISIIGLIQNFCASQRTMSQSYDRGCSPSSLRIRTVQDGVLLGNDHKGGG